MASGEQQPKRILTSGRAGKVDRRLQYDGGSWDCASTGRWGFRRGRRGGQWVAISVAMVAIAPVWIFVGYPLERSWGRPANRNRLAYQVTRHPVAIALSAPMRFLADRLRRGGRALGDDNGPPNAGDREPRRPKPTLPSDALALGEPRS
jgi:hypothetical protein